MSERQAESILIPCEGAGCPTHLHGLGSGICSMCGHRVPIDRAGNAKAHERDDVLARIDRGDFSE